jgi:hypothetical protein
MKHSKSFVELVVEAYSAGLASGLRGDLTSPHYELPDLELARDLGIRDGAAMRDRKTRLNAGGVYQS